MTNRRDRAAARSATGGSARGVDRGVGEPLVLERLPTRPQRLHHDRLGMLRTQRAPELLGTPRPQHPERNIGGDPAAQLNITASSCPTCHMSSQEHQFCRVHQAMRRESGSAKTLLDPAW